MENFDLGKAVSVFLLAFIVFIVIMIAFFARLVSRFMVRNNTTNLSTTYAHSVEPIETPLETLHTTTVTLSRLSDDYIKASEENKKLSYDLLLTMAQARKQSLNSVLEDNPSEILSSLFPDSTRSQLPDEIKTFIETPVIVEGQLKISTIEDKNAQSLKNYYKIISRNGEEFNLYFQDDKTVPIADSHIRIHGIQVDNKIVVQSINTIQF